jgi:hypothetical protein
MIKFMCEYVPLYFVFVSSAHQQIYDIYEDKEGVLFIRWMHADPPKCIGPPSYLAPRGHVGPKQNVTQVSGCFIWRLRKNFRDFFNRVFELEPPLLRNAQNRDKTKPSKTTEGGKKNGGKKTQIVL